MSTHEMQSLQHRFIELQQRGLALERQWHEHADFAEHVAALLREREADCIGDLPIEDQRVIAERLSRLTPESELEVESAELDRLSAELFSQLPPDIFPVQ